MLNFQYAGQHTRLQIIFTLIFHYGRCDAQNEQGKKRRKISFENKNKKHFLPVELSERTNSMQSLLRDGRALKLLRMLNAPGEAKLMRSFRANETFCSSSNIYSAL